MKKSFVEPRTTFPVREYFLVRALGRRNERGARADVRLAVADGRQAERPGRLLVVAVEVADRERRRGVRRAVVRVDVLARFVHRELHVGPGRAVLEPSRVRDALVGRLAAGRATLAGAATRR